MKYFIHLTLFSIAVTPCLCGCGAQSKTKAPSALPTVAVATVAPVAQRPTATSAWQKKKAVHNKIQHEYLNNCFPVIKRVGNKVRVRVRLGTHLNLPPGVRDFKIGDSFDRLERDFSSNYVIHDITDQGVVIGYNVSRVPMGEVKLSWKP